MVDQSAANPSVSFLESLVNLLKAIPDILKNITSQKQLLALFAILLTFIVVVGYYMFMQSPAYGMVVVVFALALFGFAMYISYKSQERKDMENYAQNNDNSSANSQGTVMYDMAMDAIPRSIGAVSKAPAAPAPKIEAAAPMSLNDYIGALNDTKHKAASALKASGAKPMYGVRVGGRYLVDAVLEKNGKKVPVEVKLFQNELGNVQLAKRIASQMLDYMHALGSSESILLVFGGVSGSCMAAIKSVSNDIRVFSGDAEEIEKLVKGYLSGL